MAEFNDGGYIPSKGRWAKVTTDAPAVIQSRACAESGCKPEVFEGELVHWSICPESEAGCTGGSCSL